MVIKLKLQKLQELSFVQEKDETPLPPPYSLVTKFINLTTGEETDSYSYGDKIEIKIMVRNRTEDELIFHASSSLDSNQLLESDFKATVPPKADNAEHLDFPLYVFQSEIQPEVKEKMTKKRLLLLIKGK